MTSAVNNRLHDIATSILYRDVFVKDDKAIRFLLTIHSHSKTSRRYPILVRTLTYKLQLKAHACVGYDLFSRTLAKMSKLSSLTISIPTQCGNVLVASLKEHGLIREVSNLFDALELLSNKATASTPYLLPRLQNLTIEGELALSELCVFRRVATLRVNDPVTYTDLAALYCNFHDITASKQALTRLHISLNLRTTEEVVRAVVGIADTFRNLEFLDIQAPYINALVSPCHYIYFNSNYFLKVLSDALAKNIGILHNVIEISFNKSSSISPTFSPNRDACLSKQKAHMMGTGLPRQSLQVVQFGSMRWKRKEKLTWDLLDVSQLAASTKDQRAPEALIVYNNTASLFYSFGDTDPSSM